MHSRSLWRLLRWKFKQQFRTYTPVSDQLFIGEVSPVGFTVERLVGSYFKAYRWKEMSDVELDMRRRILYFHTQKNRTFLVPEANHQGWYKLLRGIPIGFASFHYDARESFFGQLSACRICGAKAVEKTRCLGCDILQYSGAPEGRPLYEKGKQLVHYADRLGPGIGNLPLPPPEGFDPAADFQLLVTEVEVYQYQAENSPMGA